MARIEGKTSEAPVPVASYSQAIEIGSIVSVAGQAGFDPATKELAGPDVGSQTRQTFRNIEAILATRDASLDDVIRVEVYLATLSDFAAMNEVYATIFEAPYPTRTTVGVELPPGMKVEITVLAVKE